MKTKSKMLSTIALLVLVASAFAVATPTVLGATGVIANGDLGGNGPPHNGIHVGSNDACLGCPDHF